MTDLSPDQEEAIRIAHNLVDMGVPIFSAPPHSEHGFALPDSWPTFRPNHLQVERWRPGWALAMVTGVVYDVLDVDPRNGGEEGWGDLLGADAVPFVYGLARTPSDGEHRLIARTHLAKTSKAARGVDLQAGADDGSGRGFVYIAPTVRVSRYGPNEGASVAYWWVSPPEAPVGELDPAMDRLREVVQLNRGGRRTVRTGPGTKTAHPLDDDIAAFADMADDWTPESAWQVIGDQLQAVRDAKAGDINNTLGGAARVLGRFVAGGYMSEDKATAMLLEALEVGGVHSDSWNVANGKGWTASTVIGAGLANGAQEPWTVDVPGDFTEAMRQGERQIAAAMAAPTVGYPPSGGAALPSQDNRRNEPGPARELPSPGMPMDVARALVDSYPAELTWWRGDFWSWTGTHWETEDEATIRGWVRLATERATYLKAVKAKGEETTFEAVNWAPTIAKVREVVSALGEGVLQRGGDDDRVLALANGVLEGVNGARTLKPHSPHTFNLTARPFAYDPEARAPHWMKFLDEVLPDAPDDQRFLQEWFGYVLSGRTDIHAVASLAGESRSGKGTILRELTAMTGTENVAAGRLDVLAGQFGMEPLIGKSLLTFGDVRWNNSNAQLAIQRILEISGEDKVTVPRKNKIDWQGTLGVRVMFAGNEIPRFSDPSRAMANRLRIVHFRQSFAGREDHGLGARLLEELPGVFNWALEGLDRLTASGKFTESTRSARLRERIGEGGDALSAFVEEYLELDPDSYVTEDDLMEAYSHWCERTRRTRDSTTAETLRSALLDQYPQVINDKTTRRSTRTPAGPRRVRAFKGLKLATNAAGGGAFWDE